MSCKRMNLSFSLPWFTGAASATDLAGLTIWILYVHWTMNHKLQLYRLSSIVNICATKRIQTLMTQCILVIFIVGHELYDMFVVWYRIPLISSKCHATSWGLIGRQQTSSILVIYVIVISLRLSLSLSISLFLYPFLSTYTYIYIYRERARERERDRDPHIFCVFLYLPVIAIDV